MASWIPVTVVPTSLATVAIETFMTELSRVMRNWADARVSRTMPPPARCATPVSAIAAILAQAAQPGFGVPVPAGGVARVAGQLSGPPNGVNRTWSGCGDLNPGPPA